jgi:hypothetical protein
MTLISLFLLSTVLLIIKNEPFTTAGAFLSICYLPGLSIFSIAKKRDTLLFEDLILAFPLSIGTSCILILVLLLCGVNIQYFSLIIQTLVGIAVIYYMVAGKKDRVYPDIEINRQELLFLFFALTLTLLLSIPFFFGVNRIGIAGHAFHHSLMVSQIINGIFPPDNPGLGGTTIGYYWGFHTLISALTTTSNFQQVQIVFILNMVSLYFIFCISYSFARAFDISEGYRYIMPLAVIGLMRSDAGILFLVKYFSGDLKPLMEITASPVEPYEVLADWMDGLSWIDTRLLFLRKFINVSGMPLAVCLIFAYLLSLLIILKNKFAGKKIYLVITGFTVYACFFNYPPLAIFLLLHAPLWTCFVFLSRRGNFKEKARDALKIALPFITAVLIVSPYMLFIIKGRAISSAGQGGLFSIDFYDQSLKNMVVFLITIPLIVSGAWIAIKRMSFSKEMVFLIIGTVLCLFLTIFTRWPFDNSYKYNYVLVLFFSLFFVFALSRWVPSLTSLLLRRIIMAGIVLFLFSQPLIAGASCIVSSFSTDYMYIFSNGQIWFNQDKQKNEAYKWIRENTPENSLVMLSYIETNLPCCGFNNNYEPAAITERNLYVIKDADYTTSNPEYAKRVEYREKLFASPEDPSVINFFSELNRPLYLLVEDKMEEDRFIVEDRFRHFPENPGRPFVLKFKNDMQRVYLIDIK